MMKRCVTLWSFITVSVATAIVFFLSVIPVSEAEVRQEKGSIPFRNAITRYRGGVRSGEIGKIIGGEKASWGNHKWQAALLVSWIANPVNAQFCGGSLVRQNWVVTAAHCVDGNTLPQDVHILTGTANLASGGKRSNVEAIYIHENYDNRQHNNDIALLKLKDNGLGEPIKPITDREEPKIVISNQKTMITGWGITESGSPSPQLKQVIVPLVARAKCNGPASYNGAITDKMICAGIDAGSQDSCQGDSGGPCTKDGYLIGIVSWGDGCAKPFKYGVYTRVSQFADWIDDCINDPASCRSK